MSPPAALRAVSEPAPTMQVLRSKADVRRWVASHHAAGRTVALVPTMGFLHDGHLSLMRAAAAHADVVMASIFVNPTQFAPNEDLDAYPRDTAGDLAKCAEVGCAAVFLPAVDEVYQPGASTVVQVHDLAQHLCGRSRPTHFAGVCTIVCKLFNITACDVAVFGQKDFQQLAIIRRMVRDLDLPVKVIGQPIVREPDGVAMSSRNTNLSAQQRAEAVALSQALFQARERFAAGERSAEALRVGIIARLAAAKGGVIDYAELVDADDLQPLTGAIERPALAAVAVRFGGTRLIDNTVLDPRG